MAAKKNITTTSLFAAVYAEPDRDDLRHVLADHLIEQGDERGELIALQLARVGKGGKGKGKGSAGKQESALLKKNMSGWCGRLDPLFSKKSRVFERGFLVAGRAEGQWKFNTAQRHIVPQVIGVDEWSTVEAFACPHYWSNDGTMSADTEGLFTHPVMRSLRVLHNIPPDLALAIEKSSSPPPRLVELGIDGRNSTKTMNALGVKGLDGVRRLVISKVISMDDVKWLWTSPLGKRVEAVTLIASGQTVLLETNVYLKAIVKHAPATLHMIAMMGETSFPSEPEGWHLQLTRDARGRFGRLEAAFGACSYGYAIAGDLLIRALGTLDRDALTAIRVEKTRAYKPSAEQHAALEAACKRFTKLDELALPA